jgi:hypothetical protein
MDKYVSFIFALEIRGYHISENQISEILNLQATSFLDETSRKLEKDKCEEDIWSHNLWCFEKESNYEEFELMCEEFFASIQNVKGLSLFCDQISDVRLHLMMNSQLAQIHTFLSVQFFKKVAELGLPMDINIVSYGCVEGDVD